MSDNTDLHTIGRPTRVFRDRNGKYFYYNRGVRTHIKIPESIKTHVDLQKYLIKLFSESKFSPGYLSKKVYLKKLEREQRMAIKNAEESRKRSAAEAILTKQIDDLITADPNLANNQALVAIKKNPSSISQPAVQQALALIKAATSVPAPAAPLAIMAPNPLPQILPPVPPINPAALPPTVPSILSNSSRSSSSAALSPRPKSPSPAHLTFGMLPMKDFPTMKIYSKYRFLDPTKPEDIAEMNNLDKLYFLRDVDKTFETVQEVAPEIDDHDDYNKLDIAQRKKILEKLRKKYTDMDLIMKGFGKANGDTEANGERSGTMKPLWSDDIERFFSHEPKFGGVLANDEIKDIPQRDDVGYVINTADSADEGEHWQAIYIPKGFDSIEFYDSFGNDPNSSQIRSIKGLVKKWGIPWLLKLKTNKVRQQGNSYRCGYFATKFLLDRFAGMSYPMSTQFLTDDGKINDSRQGEKNIQRAFGYI